MKKPDVGTILCDACGGPVPEGTMICRFCGAKIEAKKPDAAGAATVVARASEPMTFCPRCRQFFAASLPRCPRCPEATDAGARGPCPACATPLIGAPLGLATIDRCERCEGVWFDGDELGKVIDLRTKGLPGAAVRGLKDALPFVPPKLETGRAKCVRCNAPMERRPIAKRAGVIVDVCKAHGIWFDKGEFGQFEAFVKAGGLEVLRGDTPEGGPKRGGLRVRPSNQSYWPDELAAERGERFSVPATISSLLQFWGDSYGRRRR